MAWPKSLIKTCIHKELFFNTWLLWTIFFFLFQSLESFCNPIVAKPKPKVEPPPKEDKKEQNGGEKKEDGKEKANNEQKEEEQPQQTPQTEGTNTAEKKDLDMEVD